MGCGGSSSTNRGYIFPGQQHPPVVPYQQHPPVVPHQQHPPVVPYQQHPPVVPHQQHPPVVPYQQHPPVVPHQQHPPVVPHQQHPSVVPQQQHPSVLPQHQHAPQAVGNVVPTYTGAQSNLFERKFVSESINNEFIWVGFSGVVSRLTLMERLPVCTLRDTVNKIMQDGELKTASNIDEVHSALKNALDSSDIRYLIFAYTIQSDFYIILNQRLSKLDVSSHVSDFLAALILKNDSHETANWPLYFTSVVLKTVTAPDSPLKSYGGKTYRGIKMTKDDLQRYKDNSIVIQKTFSSSSKNPEVARGFAKESKGGEITALLTFVLDDPNTVCIDLEGVSAFRAEEEVLILPLSIFIVSNVNQDNANGFTEIELRAFSATLSMGSVVTNLASVAAPVSYIGSALKAINPLDLTLNIARPFLDRLINRDDTRNNNDEEGEDGDEGDQDDEGENGDEGDQDEEGEDGDEGDQDEEEGDGDK